MTEPRRSILGYVPTRSRHDEAIDGDGAIRPAFRGVAAGFPSFGPGGLDAAARELERVLEARAATHVLHDGTGAASRPWRLDPLPIVIDADDWAVLAEGVRQRLRLLEAVLDDLYGQRELLIRGVVPIEAVTGQPAYRHAAIGMRPPAGRRLVVYGVDVIRTAEGSWRVLRDATDAPAGLGYAMLNRAAMSRVLPEALRRTGVARLTPFESSMRAALASCAPPAGGASRVVVLSGGPDHDSYVEHSVLAASLGYHLAEPQDLVVTDRRVWLRSVERLEPVDVLYRRLEDAALDPLELGAPHGVAGLVNAARHGTIGMANHVGAALAGSFGLAPFLEACARELLGERLRLAPLTARWCGDPDDRADVLRNIERYVLHDTAPHGPVGSGARAAFGDRLSGRDAVHWYGLLRDAPERLVAQERVVFGTCPTVTPDGIRPGEAVVRLIAVQDADGRIDVLPGGVGRIVDPSRPVLAAPRGAASGVVKDVWVMGGGGSAAVVSRSVAPIDLRESVPTRSAEAMWWLGRWLERADAAARLGRAIIERIDDDPAQADVAEGSWTVVCRGALQTVTSVDASVAPAAGRTLGDDLADLIAGPVGLAASLRGVGRTADAARQFLSRSTWRLLRDLDGLASGVAAAAEEAHGATSPAPRAEEELERVIVVLAALGGLLGDSTVRGPAWRFLELGRRTERIVASAHLLETLVAPIVPVEYSDLVLDTVLAAHESLVAYRRRYRTDPVFEDVMDLLAADETNPRSLQFQLDRLREHGYALPDRPARGRFVELVDTAARAVVDAGWRERRGDPVAGRRSAVDRFVVAVRGPVLDAVDVVVDGWFSDRPVRRLGGLGGGPDDDA